MNDRELMQQALEALEQGEKADAISVGELITALRERLAQPEPAPGYCQHCKQYTIEEPLPAQPEQEPVAWGYRDRYGNIIDVITPEEHARAEGDYNVPLYAKEKNA